MNELTFELEQVIDVMYGVGISEEKIKSFLEARKVRVEEQIEEYKEAVDKSFTTPGRSYNESLKMYADRIDFYLKKL